MKRSCISSVFGALLLTCGLAAANPQVITLKDGSQIKGELVSVAAGAYTIKTPLMGEVHINTDQVVSISTEGVAPVAAPTLPSSMPMNPNMPAMPATTAGGDNLDQRITDAQSQLMGNPDMMTDIQNFAQDPEITQLISDPELMQKIMAKDVTGIQNDPKGQALMNNPKMKALIEKLRSSGVSTGQ